jgi:fumarate hydratase class I
MSDMVTIREQDLIESVADAPQCISYYHPMDYIRAPGAACKEERGPLVPPEWRERIRRGLS